LSIEIIAAARIAFPAPASYSVAGFGFALPLSRACSGGAHRTDVSEMFK
jgi:hypothetical protein